MKRLRGFTLIELLIVVAIIAILAAIAVPNFMEAQVRAKITRCKSDMRVMALGCEAYAVDHNKYPLDAPDWLSVSGVYENEPMTVITTPVAYISGLLKDPFIVSGQKNPGVAENKNIGGTFMYKAAHRGLIDIATGQAANGPNTWKGKLLARGYFFMLFSTGPSRNRAAAADPTQWIQPQGIILGARDLEVYDSTNGTKSQGLIIRTNKNEYTGADYVKI